MRQDIDGEIIDIIDWRLDDAVELIRGRKGAIVRLEILLDGTGAESPSKIIFITEIR